MSIKGVTILGENDSLLRKRVDYVRVFGPAIYSDLHDLRDTMKQIGAVGLAANQIGLNKRLIVFKIGNDRVIEFVNPTIVFKKGKIYSAEGCVSIPNYVAIIPRAPDIKVEYQTRDGHPALMSLAADYAIRAQHEIDHLDGILIKDYVDGTNGKKGGISGRTGTLEQ